MKQPKPTAPILPFMLGAIYSKSDARKLLGVGTRTMNRLQREGKLEVRKTGNRYYVCSDDVWNAMTPVNRHLLKSVQEEPTEVPSNAMVLTEAEAAQLLKIKPRTLAEERIRGRITHYRIVGNRIRYTREMLEDYLQNHPLNEKQSSDGGRDE